MQDIIKPIFLCFLLLTSKFLKAQSTRQNNYVYSDKALVISYKKPFQANSENLLGITFRKDSMSNYEIILSQGDISAIAKNDTTLLLGLYNLKVGPLTIYVRNKKNYKILKTIGAEVEFYSSSNWNGPCKIFLGSYIFGCIPLSYLKKLNALTLTEGYNLINMDVYFVGVGFDAHIIYNLKSSKFSDELLTSIQKQINPGVTILLDNIQVQSKDGKILSLRPQTFEIDNN